MKKLFLLAWPIALAAVSCSNEEVVSVNNDANEIKFTATAENGTRAANLFCNITKPTNFHVWAAVDNAQYFANASFSDPGDGTFLIDGGSTRYWPDATVDFYALSEKKDASNYEDWTANYNGEGVVRAFDWKPAGGSTVKWETRSFDATAQTDLLYAYARHTRPAYDVPAVINFRHALSQIVFKAQNKNKTIHVEIEEVKVVNVAKGGVFTMPSTVTTPNVENHKTEGTYPTTATSICKWTSWTDNTEPYTTGNFGLQEVKPDEKVVNLTEETMGDNAHSGFDHSLLLVPQTTTAWKQSETATKDPDNGQTGSYFMVKCRIRNIAGAEVADDDIYLYGSSTESKYVYIPFAADWKPGKKYIYTFVFGGKTTGGFDDKGDPVLFPISFKITVDDFVKVNNENVWMGPDETPATEPEP